MNWRTNNLATFTLQVKAHQFRLFWPNATHHGVTV